MKESNGAPHPVKNEVLFQNETENALWQSEANLRQIMDLIPQPIFTKDFNGKFVFVNKSFAELYGLSPKEFMDKSLYETTQVTNEYEYLLKQDQEVILSGTTKIIAENSLTDHKGIVHLFYTVKVPFTVAGTNEHAVLGIALDITEQKLAEAERSKMIADIVQRNKDLEQFSYIISHNLRAPVANILGLTNIIQTIKLSKEETVKVIGYLDTATKNLDNVIKDINHILELKHGVNERKEKVRFSDLLEEIKLSISNVIHDEWVKITSDFSEVDEILTIKSYLYSIFSNLITNSIKYRKPSLAPAIEISSVKDGNKIQLLFTDNGLGIDMKTKGSEIFGLYKRFHTHVEGKGMGLYMVKTQIETLGGTIDVESEVNKGTTFTIEFEIK